MIEAAIFAGGFVVGALVVYVFVVCELTRQRNYFRDVAFKDFEASKQKAKPRTMWG